MIVNVRGYCTVQHLLDKCSAVKGLTRSIVVVVVSEPLRPATSARGTTPPERIKTVDSHRQRLKPFFDGVSLTVLELTAQPPAKQGRQVAGCIHQKLGV